MPKEAKVHIKNNNLTKSKFRIRDHGEVFTPDFIVDDMLDLVKNETERKEYTTCSKGCLSIRSRAKFF